MSARRTGEGRKTVLDWYFDFISPYSYLQTARFDDLPEGVEIRFRPLLFAGLLNHWGQLGPAEIPTKRLYMYRYVEWLGRRMGLALRVPPAHPFNPLRALRLAIALGSGRQVVETVFRCIWAEGLLPDAKEGWRGICRALGIAEAEAAARIGDPAVKDQLRANGEEAIAAGVFGVPTFVHAGQPFWGFDGTDFLIDVLRRPPPAGDGDLARFASLPASARRR